MIRRKGDKRNAGTCKAQDHLALSGLVEQMSAFQTTEIVFPVFMKCNSFTGKMNDNPSRTVKEKAKCKTRKCRERDRWDVIITLNAPQAAVKLCGHV